MYVYIKVVVRIEDVSLLIGNICDNRRGDLFKYLLDISLIFPLFLCNLLTRFLRHVLLVAGNSTV